MSLKKKVLTVNVNRGHDSVALNYFFVLVLNKDEHMFLCVEVKIVKTKKDLKQKNNNGITVQLHKLNTYRQFRVTN